MLAMMMPQYALKLLLPLFYLNLIRPLQSQGNGDEICVEGFIMDKFCVDLGTLLDKPDLISLEYPGEHSLHCLVDVQSCYESPFLVLKAPEGGSSMYTVAYQVDDSGREKLIALARASGLSGKYPACSTCTNTGDNALLQGFRAEVFGIVTDSSVNPPILTVTSAFVSNGRATSEICVLQQNSVPPTRSPQTAAPVANPIPIFLPTARPITTKPVTLAPTTSFPAAVPSSSPSFATSTQESLIPTSGPSKEPMQGEMTEPPSQVESSVPSYEPASRSISTPVPSRNMTTITNNTTTNAMPTLGNAGSQNDVANNTGTSDADSIQTKTYLTIFWWLLQNALWLVPFFAIC